MVTEDPIYSILNNKPLVYPDVKSVNSPMWFGTAPFKKILGCTIHYTADRDALRTFKSLMEKKCGYHLVIDRQGLVHQGAYFTHKVNHAGVAAWNGVSPNSHHIAIAVCSWGRLDTNGVDWRGRQVLPGEWRMGHDKKYGWDKATPAAEASLLKVCHWLIENFGLTPGSFCGHDECAIPKGRKTDPGEIFTFSMAELRSQLASERTKKGGV